MRRVTPAIITGIDGDGSVVGKMDYIVAWQCIGCGKIEAPQPCIGVCQDRKVLMVGKGDYETVVAQRDALRERLDKAHAMLQRFGLAKPRAGQWRQSWEALQAELREVLAQLAD